MDNNKKIRMGLLINPKLRDKFQAKCFDNNVTMTDAISGFMKAYAKGADDILISDKMDELIKLLKKGKNDK